MHGAGQTGTPLRGESRRLRRGPTTGKQRKTSRQRQLSPPLRVTPDSFALISPRRISCFFSHAMFVSKRLGQRIKQRFGDQPSPAPEAVYGFFFRSFLRRREQLSFLCRSRADTAGSSPAPHGLTAAAANQGAPGEDQTGKYKRCLQEPTEKKKTFVYPTQLINITIFKPSGKMRSGKDLSLTHLAKSLISSKLINPALSNRLCNKKKKKS